MSNLPWDVRNWEDADREAFAERIRIAPDFSLPELDMWNTSNCRKHRMGWVEDYHEDGVDKKRVVTDRPCPGCRDCAIVFRRHQRVSIAWLYFKKHALLADTMGPQPLSAKVLTPTGWSTMGEMKEGTEVVDPFGQKSVVEQVHRKGVQPVYRLTFSDGSYTRASGSHRWLVNTPDRKFHHRPPVRLSTDELLSRGLQQKNGNNKFYIPLLTPPDLRSSEGLTLDPYFVGAWLGDGSGSRLATDHALVSSLVLPQNATVQLYPRAGDAPYFGNYAISGLRGALREAGLSGSSESKRIPTSYLWSSVETRLALLQGLLDTDGTPGDKAGVEWGTVSSGLADDMEFLLGSIGATYRRSLKSPTYTYGEEKKTGRDFHRFYISFPSYVDPFRLERKKSKYVMPTKYEPTRAIVSIEPDGEEEVWCISVSAESHLYVTDDFIVTSNSGKTTSAGGLLAMMKQTGELADPDQGGMGRALIIPRSPALRQWQAELHRMMPTLNTQIATGTRKDRRQIYADRWDVLLIGPQMLAGSTANPGDYKPLMETHKKFSLVLTDDIDLLRNMENGAYKAIEALGNRSDRVVIMTGTPLQKRLDELYAQLHPLGGERLFGTLDDFKSRHIRREKVAEVHPTSKLIVGYKQQTSYHNMDILKKKIRPLYLRRTAADLEDVELPTINPTDVFLDLYPRQRDAYKELQRGVVTLLKDGEIKSKAVHARAKLTYGAQICTGLAALGQPDEPQTSVKLDWVMNAIKPGGDLGNEKVVVFAQYKNAIRALQARLTGHDIGFVTVWGEDNNMQRRQDAVERFWRDPECRVLMGTQAIEQSLNLQVSRHLINLDMIMNPARMEQLAGRIRRDGSAYKHVFVHNLLTVDTQEERYLPLLEREAALAGYVWDESSELFSALSPEAMLRLITG